MIYAPDNWVVIKYPTHYRLLVGWSGGYTTGSSWRMSSDVLKVSPPSDNDPHYLFQNNSGSLYNCHKDAYCLRMNNAYVWTNLQEQLGDEVSIMDENTNWLDVDWGANFGT